MQLHFEQVAAKLGTGEEEHAGPVREMPPPSTVFREGDIFVGHLRERDLGLRFASAAKQDSDTHIMLAVQADGRARLFVLGEEIEVVIRTVATGTRAVIALVGSERTLSGQFDSRPEWFRGTVVDNDNRRQEVASFALRKDIWKEPPVPSTSSVGSDGTKIIRALPRLWGAVNCGRFPEFCRQKGVEPNAASNFPEVRVIFPQEERYELYQGTLSSSAQDLAAFAREASRVPGPVRQLDEVAFSQLQKGPPTTWLLLLHLGRFTKASSSRDCPLCSTALPLLRRTSLRLAAAGVQAAWVECFEDKDLCRRLTQTAPEHSLAGTWGQLLLIEAGDLAAPGEATIRSKPLWDGSLLPTDGMRPVGLLAALEAAAATAEFLAPPAAGEQREAQTSQVPRRGHLAEL